MRTVPKPWGHELIFAENEKYAGKILHLEPGQGTLELAVGMHVSPPQGTLRLLAHDEVVREQTIARDHRDLGGRLLMREDEELAADPQHAGELGAGLGEPLG